jgi:hypothetical protein
VAIEPPSVGGAFRHLLSATVGGRRAYKFAENSSNLPVARLAICSRTLFRDEDGEVCSISHVSVLDAMPRLLHQSSLLSRKASLRLSLSIDSSPPCKDRSKKKFQLRSG